MKLEELKKKYPDLPDNILAYFINYPARGLDFGDFSFREAKDEIKNFNESMVFNLPAVLDNPDMNFVQKLPFVFELVRIACLATAYKKELDYLKKSKKNIETDFTEVVLDKVSDWLNPPQIIVKEQKQAGKIIV